MSWDICPVCNGSGKVTEGFYRQNNHGYWSSSGTGFEKCRTCNGFGALK